MTALPPPCDMSDLIATYLTPEQPQYPDLTTLRDRDNHADWYLMNGAPRPCFTPALLTGLLGHQRWIRDNPMHDADVRFVVCASLRDGIFNLGGDLSVFCELIEKQDRDGLLGYGMRCIKALVDHTWHLDCPNTISINLVQGDALGGGFESALSATTIIAERGVKMGFPEALFNLFPGMGAYSYLSRRIPSHVAKRMILSGDLFSAEALYEMGVVDILAEKDRGIAAVYDYINSVKRNPNSHLAMQRIAHDDPRYLSEQELTGIVSFWADSALKLRDKDLRMMRRLVNRQDKLE